MSRFVDLQAMRREIAEAAERIAREHGIESPRASVLVSPAPDRRGRRGMAIEVVEARANPRAIPETEGN